jgi:hypothetical protein
MKCIGSAYSIMTWSYMCLYILPSEMDDNLGSHIPSAQDDVGQDFLSAFPD